VLHRIDAGDTGALLAFVATQRARAQARAGVPVAVVFCFEAGRDGFWLHWFLLANNVINYIVEPTSILVGQTGGVMRPMRG
jgi:transposase